MKGPKEEPKPLPILITGAGLLLGIDVIQTAVYKAARASGPRRGFDRETVRRVLEERIGCPLPMIDLQWHSRVGMPIVFDFLQTNARAFENAEGPFDASDFLEHQIGVEDLRVHEGGQPRAAYRKLFTMIASGELTEKDFQTP